MYLFDSQAFSDFVSGDTSKAAWGFFSKEEKSGRDVLVSRISIGLLSAEIENLQAMDRINWRKRLSNARRLFEVNRLVREVTSHVVDEWAEIRNMELQDSNGAPLGDSETLVIATAIAHQLSLVTSSPNIYAPVVQNSGLLVTGI
ncbi:hypothetical protein [uncultured Thalassospira sp.]|uniref:type II toxin-antitoxin system VapC family toxin n=1 Tax=uncultured Thalassospira sp. TaxID=404382 RepID=UPI0025826CE3|nr:hypothetical protein [uncultured Thalassospira sp.]